MSEPLGAACWPRYRILPWRERLRPRCGRSSAPFRSCARGGRTRAPADTGRGCPVVPVPGAGAGPAGGLLAQVGDPLLTGFVTGTVRDSLGLPVAGAEVGVSGLLVHGTTADDGVYRIAGVPTGPRVIRVRRLGFRPDSVRVQVPPGGTVTGNVTLRVLAQQIARRDGRRPAVRCSVGAWRRSSSGVSAASAPSSPPKRSIGAIHRASPICCASFPACASSSTVTRARCSFAVPDVRRSSGSTERRRRRAISIRTTSTRARSRGSRSIRARRRCRRS